VPGLTTTSAEKLAMAVSSYTARQVFWTLVVAVAAGMGVEALSKIEADLLAITGLADY
jgi:hypothetical protein